MKMKVIIEIDADEETKKVSWDLFYLGEKGASVDKDFLTRILIRIVEDFKNQEQTKKGMFNFAAPKEKSN
jgi:hypothetical protein